MTKSNFKLILLFVALSSLVMTSCKKTDTATDDTVSATDQSNVSQHMNNAMDDATNAASGVKLSGKMDGAHTNLCNVAIDTTQIDSGTIILTYNGLGCEGIYDRTGKITIHLRDYPAKHWKDMGATMDVTMSNFKLLNVNNNTSVTYNGTHTITNTTGGLAWKIIQGLSTGSVSHRHTATNMQLTFDDGSQRTWSIDRTRTFSNNTGTTLISLSSDNNVDGFTHVEAWGTNRKGNTFHNMIPSPITATNLAGCDPYFGKPYTGEYNHTVGSNMLDVLFGGMPMVLK